MSDIAIKVENLSKQYRLGEVGTGTISHDLNRWWAKMRGKEDPFLKIGETNDRSKKGNSEYVWALKDINFEVKKGEVLGIIGKNGAGKSTLLKILSKVTGPTTGEIKGFGRIASLLEVGTGFHPELTGRENIYLNGTILGMTKVEVSKKLDEIVDFAGVERYLDTPIKRFSSGMSVRLGFAIAAHLEPEILIVDEVLAVGDVAFQKKAIGKIQEVSGKNGRTVLFVSHNMASIKSICSRSIILNNGTILSEGSSDKIVERYLKLNKSSVERKDFDFPILLKEFGLHILKIDCTRNDQSLLLKIDLFLESSLPILGVGIKIQSVETGAIITNLRPYKTNLCLYKLKSGTRNVFLRCNDFFNGYNAGSFLISIWLSDPKKTRYVRLDDLFSLTIEDTDFFKSGHYLNASEDGLMAINFEISDYD